MSAVEQYSPEEKASVFQQINQEIPRSTTGFPEYIYRADMIPADFRDLPIREQHETLSKAVQPLSFHEGFPTFDNGLPFWEQLPFEPTAAFDAFITYLSLPMKDLPARRVWELRQLDAYKGIEIGVLSAMATIYYWVDRARAFDLFVQINHKLAQSRRIMELETTHYSISGKLFKRSYEALEAAMDNEERLAEVPIPRLAEMVERFARIQRTAVGLTAAGSISYLEMQGPKGASLRAAYESAAAEDAPKATTNSQAEITHQTNMRALLSDPQALEAAQELVIKMMSLSTPEAKRAEEELSTMETNYTADPFPADSAYPIDIDAGGNGDN